ncbi:related to triacylglycerol lipase [Rhynchosporium agropyri]|uniref:Related to triacylglycerol lipase n=1 Tax=Rhynchosporium agropyri TaxID=914238 RepID=A0A1E1KFS4_9HELO|nr:related to triacylglycerol lipase [Rhynchosporium agropyri]
MAAQQNSSGLKIYDQKPFFQRFEYLLRTHILKTVIGLYFRILSLPFFRDTSILPTYTKVYPCRPTLTNRIFIPKSYKPDDALLPLFLDIHGGGFCMMSPSCDDKFCSEFANTNKVLVVSIDYPKSPANPYPAAVKAVTDIVNAILADKSLPFDKKKVAIGGFSAGGNLALAVSQDDSLQGKLGGVVAYYPPTNWTTTLEEKLATKPKDSPPDRLEANAPAFDWAYIPPGTDLEDPQLSVAFAPRDELPPKIYIIGCELDLLCGDSEVMARNLANIGHGQRVGTEHVWEQNGVKWEKILGEEHGFDATPATGAKQIRVTERRDQMHADVFQWLSKEVYI